MEYKNNYEELDWDNEEIEELDWDDEIDNDGYYNLFKPGDYKFKVKECEKSVSSNGNNMIVLELEVYDGAKTTHVKDWLTLTERAKWKLRNFLISIGLKEKGGKIKLELDKYKGRTGYCTLKQNEFTSNKTRQRCTGNCVKNYLEPKTEDFEW